MPYFVILALAKKEVNITPLTSICAFFGNFVTGSLLKASLLIWRSISYYLPMIIGGVLFSTNTRKEDIKCE